jgi:filamentous hemagglutinin family protein
MYREFNVEKNGVIFNNNVNNVTSKHGNIAKNNNLSGAAASVILNEVISDKASTLAGFLEVSGQKADVIVANPNGITCSGCSFVNTNKSILTTGKVNLAENGRIANYTVTKGTIDIDSKGMTADNYTVLLADAIKINGTINTNNALLSAGNFTLNDVTGELKSSGKKANLVQQFITPTYSIDISELGGISANSISMIGNDLGLGVRNKGAIIANNSLSMSSNGLLFNDGAITSNGAVTQLAAAGDIRNFGTIETKNTTLLHTQSKTINYGSISRTKQLMVNSTGDVENRGTIHSDDTLAITTNGNLTNYSLADLNSSGQLSVNAQNNVVNDGAIKGQNVLVNFGGNELKVKGKMQSDNALTVRSVSQAGVGSGNIANVGQMIAGSDMQLDTNGTLTQSSGASMKAQGSLIANSKQLINNGSMSGMTLTLGNNKTENTGTITGNRIALSSAQGIANEGTIKSTGNATLTTQNSGSVVNRGTIQAAGTLTVSTKTVDNGGYRCGFLNLKTCGAGTLSAEKLVLNSSHNYASDMRGTQNFKSIQLNGLNGDGSKDQDNSADQGHSENHDSTGKVKPGLFDNISFN